MIPDVESEIRIVAEKLRKAGGVSVLTGAGVSAQSGVPTFRDADGAFLVEVNPEPTPLSDEVDIRGAGTSARVLPRLARLAHLVRPLESI